MYFYFSDPTNYSHWYNAKDPFAIEYSNWFEPYYIVAKNAPRFDPNLFYTVMDKV